MKALSKIRAVFRNRDDSPSDVIATLLLAAKEDPDLRRRIEFLLRLPAMQRNSVVNTALHEMELRDEAPNIRAAFATLATEEGALAARRALDSD